jgi:hypothetical protein
MKAPLFVALICLASCAQKPAPQSPVAQSPQPHKKDSILIRIIDTNQTTPVIISPDLEPDTFYNRLLAEYIQEYEYGVDSPWSATKLAPLVNRQSFLKMVLLFYGKGQLKHFYLGISYSDAWYRLEDIGAELFHNAYDCCHERYYTLADTLLTQDEFNGAEYLWGEADLRKLPSLNAYVSRVEADSNFMELTDLAAFFHNNGNYAQRDSCMSYAARIKDSHKQYLQLKGLITKNKTFDYATYSELLYNTAY